MKRVFVCQLRILGVGAQSLWNGFFRWNGTLFWDGAFFIRSYTLITTRTICVHLAAPTSTEMLCTRIPLSPYSKHKQTESLSRCKCSLSPVASEGLELLKFILSSKALSGASLSERTQHGHANSILWTIACIWTYVMRIKRG